MGNVPRMTNPATNTKQPAAKKATTTKAKAKATTAKPAPKASTTKATKAASTTPTPAVETKVAKPSFASTTDATELAVKHEAMTKAVHDFESFVCDLITEGVSPTHIGNVIGLGNSSVRRIAMRNGLAVK